ncbi:MAG: hypothetical protein ACUVTQ_12410 [Desulfotomaculales bacterium]
MAFVAEEAKKEQLPEVPYRVASPEFFFLLQRIDRLDEKFSGQIAALDAKLSGQIAALDAKLTGQVAALRQEMREEIAGVRREMSGARTLILTTFGLILGALALMGTVLGVILK